MQAESPSTVSTVAIAAPAAPAPTPSDGPVGEPTHPPNCSSEPPKFDNPFDVVDLFAACLPECCDSNDV